MTKLNSPKLCLCLALSCFILAVSSLPALAQSTPSTPTSNDLCREAIPSIGLRHLRSGRFAFFDSVNEQIASRYSEFLDPTFGGYVIEDNIGKIVNQSKPIGWGAISYSSGNREFSACKANVSIMNLTSGVDLFVSEQNHFLIGLIGGISANGMTVPSHPIAGKTETGTTNANEQILVAGAYAAYMTEPFNVSLTTTIHYNSISFSPLTAVQKTTIDGTLGFSSQLQTSFNITQGAINHQLGASVLYESFALNAFPLATQNNVIINYDAIDLSNFVPGIRWQSSAYYATNHPDNFIGWKATLNARRVYPLGPSSWQFTNQITGTTGKVNLDSEWTELALDASVSMRSIHSREIYAALGYKSVFGEHPSQKLGGNDLTVKVGVQVLF